MLFVMESREGWRNVLKRYDCLTIPIDDKRKRQQRRRVEAAKEIRSGLMRRTLARAARARRGIHKDGTKETMMYMK